LKHKPVDAIGLTGLPQFGNYVSDANSYDTATGYYTETVPDGFYTTWLNEAGGRWYQIVGGFVVATGWCFTGIGAGSVTMGNPGNTGLTPPPIGSGTGSSTGGVGGGGSTTTPSGGMIPSGIPPTCIPAVITPGTCNFPNASVNFICNLSFGMAVPANAIMCTSAVRTNGFIYYKQMSAGQSSAQNGTDFNNTIISGTGVNTQGINALRRYNTNNAVSEIINTNYPISWYMSNYDQTSMILDYTAENIIIGRVNSPAVITNSYTNVEYDQAPSIIKYNIASGVCIGSDYVVGINHNLDFSTVTGMYEDSISGRIVYATLAYHESGTTSRYMSMILRDVDLSYMEHKEFEIPISTDPGPTDPGLVNLNIYGTYPTVAIDDSSYYFDSVNQRLFVPARDYTSFSLKLLRRSLVLNYNDNSVSVIDVNSLNTSDPTLGIKFYSDSTLDYIYNLDVLTGRLTALDPNNYSIVDEWNLEDPIYQSGTECIFKSFAIRKTPSNKIICYYITTAVNTSAPGSPSTPVYLDPVFYDTKVCATRIINGGTTGTIYSGYVNAPYGYPGLSPRVKLMQDDPESVYIVGDTVFRMCNLINGE